MPSRRFLVHDQELETGFAAIRQELDVPVTFDDEVIEQAERAAARGPQLPPGAGGMKIRDATDIPFVAIDPPGSRDLDQIFSAETRSGGGWRVFYGIADVASFVHPGGAIDDESMERGVTLYSPDMRASLHPEAINENAASLLAGQQRQGLLWTIDLDSDGRITATHFERATVKSRQSMTYREAQTDIDNGTGAPALQLLKEIGLARQEQERQRGAVSLQLPAQEIKKSDTGYRLVYDEEIPVEGWNAQISLLTGIAAARIMVEGGIGLLRTLPTPDEHTIDGLRRTARGLGLDWPADMSYADRVRTLTSADPVEAAMLSRSARGLRGAGYDSFKNGEIPEHPEHSAIASIYAHVTAPLRRACDRFSNEVLLALVHDREVPDWAAERLPELPAIMGRSNQHDRSLERTITDYVEAVCLRDRVGETFDAVVTGNGRDTSNIMLAEPAVIAPIRGKHHELGSVIPVTLTGVDIERRKVTFEPSEKSR